VKTVTGTFTGLQHPAFHDVRQFLNIPYAQPPIEDRR
jgi:carboxylesterase type B